MTRINTYSRHKTLLVVDDTPENLSLMGEMLGDQYRVRVANNGERALKIAAGESPPDLILLDIMMPGMDGYKVCERLKADPITREIPVIFLTAHDDEENEKLGLELGAVDFITKPISPLIVKARIKTHLDLKASADLLRDRNIFLERAVAKRTEALLVSNNELRSLAARIETVTEAERRTIAQEIHDDLGQLLTTLKLDLSFLRTHFAGNSQVSERLDKMNEILITTISRVRSVTASLRPVILDELGVVAAIEAYLQSFAAKHMRFHLVVPRRDIEVDRERGLSIFRIFQETMTNILRHADATEVDILLDITHERVVLQIRDNGCGISKDDMRKNKTLGLLGMRERTMRWGGKFDIARAPQRGTIIEATIPMQGAASY